MWDASVNDVQYVSREKDPYPASLFCRTCLANQTLVTNLLASYLPEEDEQLDDERMRAYPDYKRSLEERYPLACEACHARAMAHLQQRDQQIQRTSLPRGSNAVHLRPRRPCGHGMLRACNGVSVMHSAYVYPCSCHACSFSRASYRIPGIHVSRTSKGTARGMCASTHTDMARSLAYPMLCGLRA